VIVSADSEKTIVETFGGMTNDEFSDMLGEVDEPELDSEESGIRLGDNRKMETVLTKIKMRVLMGSIDHALKQPVVMQGVKIEANNLTGTERVSGGIDANLDLVKIIGRENADEALLKCLGKKLRSQKFKGTWGRRGGGGRECSSAGCHRACGAGSVGRRGGGRDGSLVKALLKVPHVKLQPTQINHRVSVVLPDDGEGLTFCGVDSVRRCRPSHQLSVRVGCDAAHDTNTPTCVELLVDLGTNVCRVGRLD
jgi:hypothetical protein